jgi:hypothetical protein
VKIKAPEPLEPKPREPAQAKAPSRLDQPNTPEPKRAELPEGRGALIQLQPPRSTSEPSGPLGVRVDLLA